MDPSPKRYSDLHSARLIEMAIINNEGYLTNNGALCTEAEEEDQQTTEDYFIVDECSTTDLIDWGETNIPFANESFDALWSKVEDQILQNDHYVSHLEVGDHPDHYLPIEITTQTAWHSLFARNIFVCPNQFNSKGKQKWRVLHAPNYTCDPKQDNTHSEAAVIIHFAKRRVLIAGMRYAGALKKALLTVQNFLLLEKDVLPMHCAANISDNGNSCVFFGLPEVEKSAFSSKNESHILGDDAHGWGKDTLFNLEGGCYVKTINLSKEKNPIIWDAIRFGAIVENVAHNNYTREPDYQITPSNKDGYCCYPLTHLKRSIQPARTGEPSNLIFLTCDTLGILPIVSKLSPEAAVYHFLSGYSAKFESLESTEVASENALQPIFSSCFGSPFMPRPAQEYAKRLLKRIEESGCDTYLVNTGWNGDPNTTGRRIASHITQSIIDCIQNGVFKNIQYEKLNILNLDIPQSITLPDIDNAILNPRNAWENQEKYEQSALQLAILFNKNFSQFDTNEAILAAGPQM